MAEEVYQQSLEIELSLRGIPFQVKQPLAIDYKKHRLETCFKPDLLVYGEIVVELKAVAELIADHEAQLFNYLRITKMRVGYLINFGRKQELQWKRYVMSDLHSNR